MPKRQQKKRMAKYKIVQAEQRTWTAPDGATKYFKSCDLEGEAGQVVPGVSVWPTMKFPLDILRVGTEIEGEIDSSGRGKKFVFPKKNYAGRSPAEEDSKNQRILFMNSTERALDVLRMIEVDWKGVKANDIQADIVRWRDWFVSEANAHEAQKAELLSTKLDKVYAKATAEAPDPNQIPF